jgi:dihydroorotate dehydrogenase (fumarate)
MTTPALLHNGAHHVRVVTEQLCSWTAEHEYQSVAQLRGSVSHAATANPSAFERSNYMKTLHSWATPMSP